jgi:hypothetical protein
MVSRRINFWLFASLLYMKFTESLKGMLSGVIPRGAELHEISEEADSAWMHVNVGSSIEQSWAFSSALSLEKALCLHRWKIWWSIPRFVPHERETPPETYFLLGKLVTQMQEPSYILLLPTIDSDGMGFSLSGTDEDTRENASGLELHGHDNNPNGLSKQGMTKALLVLTGSDPHEMIEKGMRIIKADLIDNNPDSPRIHEDSTTDDATTSTSTTASPGSLRSKFERGPGPSFADFFGWCTWDSYYTDLSSERVLEGLGSFRSTGVRPRFLILDDGWQKTSVDDKLNSHQWKGKLTGYHPNFKFSNGYRHHTEKLEANQTEGTIPGLDDEDMDAIGSLRGLIQMSKEEHAIEHFFVWHTLSGYWTGIDPDASAFSHLSSSITYPHWTGSMKRMSVANELEREPSVTDGLGLLDTDSVHTFFDEYHSLLKGMGVTGVKVDAQSIVPALVAGSSGGWERALAFHKGLKASVSKHFDRTGGGEHNIIHCMCHSHHILLSIATLYTSSGSSSGRRGLPVIRGSDDFWPLEDASHGPHLFINSLNSLFFPHLGLHDWDMFQTDLGRSSALHAASRAISGGPVYVSDRPGTHSGAILRKLAFADGSVPRCIRNAQPTMRSIFGEPDRTVGEPLILQNANPAGGGVVGVFSIAGATLENDKDMFRFLKEDEMTWREGERACGENLDATDEAKSCDENSKFAIRANVLASDIRGLQRKAFIGFRASDQALIFLESDHGSERGVAVHLPAVMDFDIVTFAPVTRLGPQSEHWIAAIGAVDMYNSGGAVLKVATHVDSSGKSGDGGSFEMILLGNGRFLVLASGKLKNLRCETITLENSDSFDHSSELQPLAHRLNETKTTSGFPSSSQAIEFEIPVSRSDGELITRVVLTL